MAHFDYNAPADVFPSRSRKGNRPNGYRRFDTMAEAIRFAVEEMSSEFLPGTIIECEDERFDSVAIMKLYRSEAYPLARKPSS